MGSKLSRLRSQTSKEEYDPFKNEQVQPSPVSHPASFNRLPTPEYGNTDREQPLTPQVLSPISPETPPQDVDSARELPRKAESRGAPTQPATLRPSASRPNILLSHSRETSGTLTVNSEPKVMRSPQPQKAYGASRILTPEPSLSNEVTSPLALPSPVSSTAQAPAIDIKFPTMPGGPLTPTTIIDGPPLETQHFQCYQAHKFMRNSRNTICPVACMMCEKKDAEARWRCNWCCLRCCATCMQVLVSIPNKDLKLALAKIEKIAIMA